MEMAEMQRRLEIFCRAKYNDTNALVKNVYQMPGHAGNSYGFTVNTQGQKERLIIRLPPPNVRWKGTADVLRQVAALNALMGQTFLTVPSGGQGTILNGSTALISWYLCWTGIL